jgi:methionyl-tRNA synthetase
MLGAQVRDLDSLDKFGLYVSGTKVTDAPQILFGRLDPAQIMPEVEKIQAQQRAEYEMENGITSEPEKPEEKPIHVDMKQEISFDDFGTMQLVVGEIVACEEVKKSKKLLCSQVKIGDQTRQIVSGIKAWYKPEEMVGKKVVVLLNLKPATLAGVLSEGMILCAEDDEGNLCVVSPEKDVKSGSEVR